MPYSSLLDVWLKVVREDCDVVNSIKDLDAEVKIGRVNPGRTSSSHMLRVLKGDPEEIRSHLYRKGIRAVRILNKGSLWVRARSCSACSILSKSDCLVIEGIPSGAREISYRLLVPGLGVMRDLIRLLADSGLQPSVVKRAEHVEIRELTPRQLEILILAYRKGYFDTPRRISLAEMAETLGVKATSLRDVIRRALKKIVRKYLSDLGILDVGNEQP